MLTEAPRLYDWFLFSGRRRPAADQVHPPFVLCDEYLHKLVGSGGISRCDALSSRKTSLLGSTALSWDRSADKASAEVAEEMLGQQVITQVVARV
jgi:hypothetical protein